MRDFPVFTTQYGVASLVLREIPYRGEAFITIQDSLEPEKLLEECVDFCRVCGAERIYARGHEYVERFPLHSIIYEMRGFARVDETKVEKLWPVTKENIGDWRQLLNRRMADVDNAGTLVSAGEKEILQSGGAYFVHDGTDLLGAGWIAEDELLLVAAVRKGAGERVMHTLMSLVPERQLKLEVVSTNARAIRLYERLGFIRTAELRRWYRVLP